MTQSRQEPAMALFLLRSDLVVACIREAGRLQLTGSRHDVTWRPQGGAARALGALQAGVPLCTTSAFPLLPDWLGPSNLALALLRGGQAELQVPLGDGQFARLHAARRGQGWRAAPSHAGRWRLVADAALEPAEAAAACSLLSAGGTTVQAALPPGPWLGAIFKPWLAAAGDALGSALCWAGLAEPEAAAPSRWATTGWTAPEWRFHALTAEPAPRLADDHPDPPAEPPADAGFALPAPPPETPLSQLLALRRSQRRHGAEPLPLAALAALLHRCLRDLGPVAPDMPGLRHRAYPSAGGRQALDWFIAAGDVAGLAPGLYRYAPAVHRLEAIGAEGPPHDLLVEAAAAWGAPEAPPQALLIAACRMGRLAPRYAGLAYRLALIEAGCALQALSLVAAEAGVAACIIGSGSASRFAERSGLAAEDVAPVAWLAVGSNPAGSVSIAQ